MFNKGTEKGFNAVIPVGGHAQPSSGTGAKLLWKKAQKNAKKNNTSDAINRIIPHRRPTDTCVVWKPKYVPSRIMSRHHWNIVSNTIISANNNKFTEKLWNQAASPDVKNIAPIDPVKGHGLNSTRWNGCRVIIVFRLRNFLLGR